MFAPPATQPPNPEQTAMQPQETMSADPFADDGVDDDEYSANIAEGLEKHLDSLTPEQQAYIVDNLTETTLNVVGLINGVEVYQYLKKYAVPEQTQTQPMGQPMQPAQGQPQQGLMAPSQPQAGATLQ